MILSFTMISEVLKDLGIPKNAILAYERLFELGGATARKLAENLGIPRSSIYDNLKILQQKGLIVESEKDGKKIFQVDNPDNIKRLIDVAIHRLQEKQKNLRTLLPTLQKQAFSVEPRIKFYSGKEGVAQVLYDLSWYSNTEILTMWPFQEMAEVLGVQYLNDFQRHRIKSGNSIRSIWPRNQKNLNLKNYTFFGTGKRHLRELRLAPSPMQWEMSYAIYGDKVSFISSRKELFSFIVQSQGFADLMKIQFETIWKISEPLNVGEKFSKDFLENIYK